MRTVVVYVHGLWLGGGESFLLLRRLSRALGAECRAFHYSSTGATFADNVASLEAYLGGIEADTLHLLAHSMGGLLLVALFDPARVPGTHARPANRELELPPGRVVLTGSPVRGSRSARRLARLPFGRAMLGPTAGEVLAGPPLERRWSGARDLGVIAGDLGVGLGKLLGPMDGPNDGTVLVDETRLPGAADELRLRSSHTGLLFSAEVARQAAAFLQTGRFTRP
jgi:hypothetical protein